MAKIPLRAYEKEIEQYIERGEVDKAIANAKNILKSYPKHIGTYRLLGKAYLESQRFSEAADILQRVLSVIPDDFLSQIGMSIIREDEGNLDAAIWHMERAYEVQPFNPAVQDELRRLYGRRDGAEPPKIRLTRGALIRMYLRGDLITQATAEAQSALAEDPQRYDVRVLLAGMYYTAGRKNDAAALCSEILSKLPFCLEANRLMAKILPNTSRAEEAQKFQQRVVALDPYEAYLSPAAPTAAQVPDQAVQVEQFLWDPSLQGDQTPDWTRTAGVAWEDNSPMEESPLPDWLDTLKPADSTAAAAVNPEAAPSAEAETPVEEKDLPDWMQSAGWQPSTRSADEIMAEQPISSEMDDAIAPAEVPDWLQSMAPTGADDTPAAPVERDAWLASIFNESDETDLSAPVQDEITQAVDEAQPAELEMPEWLSQAAADQEYPAEQASTQAPDALQTSPVGEEDLASLLSAGDLQSQSADDAEIAPPLGADWSVDQPAGEPDSLPETNDLPEWMQGLELVSDQPAAETVEPSDAVDLPDWLSDLNGAPAALESEVDSPATDWMGALNPHIPPEEAQAQSPGTDELPDWMAGMQPAEADTIPSETLETYPEIAASAQNNPFNTEEAPETVEELSMPSMVDESPAQPSAVLDDPFAEQSTVPDFDLSDADAAMAWLESLAAKQGADEATLFTPIEQRTETAPEWVQRAVEDQAAAFSAAGQDDQAAQTVIPTSAEELDAESVAAALQDLSPIDKAEVSVDDASALDAALPQGQAASAATDFLVTGLPEAGEDEAAFTFQEPADEGTQAFALPSDEDAFDTEMPAFDAAIAAPPTVESIPAVEETVAMLEVESTPPTPADSSSADLPFDMDDADAAMAWLEGLAAKQGADEATLITPPEQRPETPPSWVTEQINQTTAAQQDQQSPVEALTGPEIQAASDEEIPEADFAAPVAENLDDETQPVDSTIQPNMAEETFAQVAGQAGAPAKMTDPSAEMDLDSAFAWLESLAAKQGADEATLVTAPEDRSETPPEWVQQEQANALQSPSATPEESAETQPEWIEQANVAQAVSTSPADRVPDTESNIGRTHPLSQAEIDELESQMHTSSEAHEAELPRWMAEPNQPAESDQRTESPMGDTASLPDWLESLDQEELTGEASVPVEFFAEMDLEPQDAPTAWVAEESALETSAAENTLSDVLPAWMQPSVDEQEVDTLPRETPAQPMPTAASDWKAETAASVQQDTHALIDLQTALERGDVDVALQGYTGLIEEGHNLDAVISDLRNALYRYPADFNIWQALGDAYARNDQIQEALDAYTKAEELLR